MFHALPTANENPLFLQGWIDFCRKKYRLTTEQLTFSLGDDRDLLSLDVLFYRDSRGRIVVPPVNRYLTMALAGGSADAADLNKGSERDWLNVSSEIAKYMGNSGSPYSMCLPHSIGDCRGWLWDGFEVSVGYTYVFDLPYNSRLASKSVRRRIRKLGAEYHCSRIETPSRIMNSLTETEERQGFSYKLTEEDICNLLETIGSDKFLVYGCMDDKENIVSSRVCLSVPGGQAIGLLAGTLTDHLKSGCAQLLTQFTLDDLEAGGATGFDWAGANIPSIAAMKSSWGGKLVQYYVVRKRTAWFKIRGLVSEIVNYHIADVSRRSGRRRSYAIRKLDREGGT